MAALRESALLPTVKCSSCGAQVRISLMGEHVCAAPGPELSPPLEHDERFNDDPYNRPFGKNGRFPGLVDTRAANHGFMNQGQLTPVSQADLSRTASPMGSGVVAHPEQPGDYLCTSGADQGEASTRTMPPFPQRPGNLGGHGDEASGMPPPSPSCKPIGDALMQRMNGMAPGPFDTNQRPPPADRRPSANQRPPPADRRPSATRRPSAVGERNLPPRKESLTKCKSHSSLDTMNPSPGMPPPSRATTPKQPRRNDYEGFGPPPTPRSAPMSMDPMAIPEGSTGPTMLSEAHRRPSMQNVPSSLLPPMKIPPARRPSLTPDTSRRPPPRTSLIPQKEAPTGSVDLAAEFGSSNPYHAPSESSSSGFSTFSARSYTSSQSSLGEFGMESETHAKMDQRRISPDKLPPGSDLRIDPQASLKSPALSSSPYPISPGLMRPGADAGYKPYVPFTPSSVQPRADASPARAVTPPPRKHTPEPQNVSSRGACKACGQAITGKSVSSADGRLTGKYHKACFVCTTCAEAFTSAEFYVLDDKPYCEQHYHRLNGSLCGGCGRGIEGEYVEDESDVKYHLECFCCLDCGVSLSGGYFEVEGKAYCERDALRRTQPPPQHYPMNPPNGMPHGQRPYTPGPNHGPGYGPGPRPYGPPSPHQGRPMGPPGQGPRPGPNPSMMMAPGMQRGPPGPSSPGRLGPNMNQGPRPMMNKRMTRLGTVKRAQR